MKQLVPVLLLLFSFASSAQQIKRCGSAEYLKTLEENDPAFAQRRAQSEIEIQQWITTHSNTPQRSVITIPVVFHVLYNDASQNLDSTVIQSQLDVINEDYGRTNPDTGQTPLAFRAVAADCDIEFCFAKRTPDDQPTNGIIHKFTTVTAFSDQSSMKFNSSGGDDAWDAYRYLNVWVAAFSNANFLGLSTFPSGLASNPELDGVVMNYKACGRIGTHLLAHYNKGRTLTHEIGHWLYLYHVWGDDGTACSGSDLVNDTPNQSQETYGCPSYPKTDNCSSSFPGIMFMNYLDYTDDECMNIFTEGQKTRMLATLNVDRASILLSNGCISVGIDEADLKNLIQIYPNPTNGELKIKNEELRIENISISDVIGKEVLAFQSQIQNPKSEMSVDVSALPPGIYFLKLKIEDPTGRTEKGDARFKVVKE